MATVTRGKHKGRECKIHQFCNDWFSVDVVLDREPDGDGRLIVAEIVSPSSLQFTRDELEQVEQAYGEGKAGTMPYEFEIEIDFDALRLKRIRRR